jgi:hypothetical protein
MALSRKEKEKSWEFYLHFGGLSRKKEIEGFLSLRSCQQSKWLDWSLMMLDSFSWPGFKTNLLGIGFLCLCWSEGY